MGSGAWAGAEAWSFCALEAQASEEAVLEPGALGVNLLAFQVLEWVKLEGGLLVAGLWVEGLGKELILRQVLALEHWMLMQSEALESWVGTLLVLLGLLGFSTKQTHSLH